MGQRLNVSITTNEGVIANCYMHWSAYPKCAMYIMQDLVQAFKENDELNVYNWRRLQKEVVNVLKKCLPGSELADESEFKALGIHFNGSNANRNDGLISVTKEGIKKTEDFEEGLLEINIEDETVYCDLIYNGEILESDIESIEDGLITYAEKEDEDNLGESYTKELVDLGFSDLDISYDDALDLANIVLYHDDNTIIKLGSSYIDLERLGDF